MPNKIDSPARLERFRLAIARDLFLRRTYFLKLALLLVPKHHPWRQVTHSTFESLREMTDTTLRPRTADGIVQSTLPRPIPTHRWYAIPYYALWVFVIYSIADTTTRRIPGPVGSITDLDETIRLIDRMEQAVTAFFAV